MNRTKLHKIERPLAYGQVEKVLVRIFWIDEQQKGAFRGKLKHLQKLGLPGLEPGKGRRIAYTRELVFQLLLALLFAQLGIDPTLVVRAVKENWKGTLAPAVEAAIDRGQAGNPVCLVVRPRLMSGGGLQISWFRRYSYVPRKNPDDNPDELPNKADEQIAGVQPWFCVIELTRFAAQLDVLLS